MGLCIWAGNIISFDCMGLPSRAKFKKHIGTNVCLFLWHYLSCANSRVRAMRDGQFWMVCDFLFARNRQRNLKKSEKEAYNSSSRQCEIWHIGSNKGFSEMTKHLIDESLVIQLWFDPNDFLVFPYIKNKFHGQRFLTPEEIVGAFKTQVL